MFITLAPVDRWIVAAPAAAGRAAVVAVVKVVVAVVPETFVPVPHRKVWNSFGVTLFRKLKKIKLILKRFKNAI